MSTQNDQPQNDQLQNAEAVDAIPTVRHDPARQRFLIEVGGQEAGFAAYEQLDGVRDFNHTVVDQAFRGKGLSRPLISVALERTKEEGMKIRPTCSAVRNFIEKYPQWQEHLG